jgi:hypothetical protein
MPIEFDEAVEFATSYMGQSLAAVEKSRSVNNGAAIRGVVGLNNNPANIVSKAKSKYEALEDLRFGVADFLERGDELPPEAIEWLQQYLRNPKRRPRDRPGPKSVADRHFHIVTAISLLVHPSLGMKPTRNDEPSGRVAKSACDAVAIAMQKLNRKPASYKTIKDIWLAAGPPEWRSWPPPG